MPTPSEAPPEQGSGCGWPVAIVILGLAILTALAVYFFLHAPGSMARDFSEAAAKLGKVFGTEVKVDNQSVTLESKAILELATVQHRVVCVTKYETKWAGSTATVIIRGVYTAKAGFELDRGATFTLDEAGRLRDESIPPAKILSVNTDEQKVFFDAQGAWKSLSARDYEEAFRQNREQADREAVQMGMLEEARTRLKERVGDILPRRTQPSLATPLP